MMLDEKDTTIRIRVDPANPGQFFACCGLLELADRLWAGAEGWFGDGSFCIKTNDDRGSLRDLLDAARSVRLAESGDIDLESGEEDQEDENEEKVSRLVINYPFELHLDWWSDKSLKTWAGSMDARKIFLAMCKAINPDGHDPLNQGQVVFDEMPQSSPPSSGKKQKKQNKREPFYFDSRRGANALSVDVGFSPDKVAKSSKLTVVAYPVVESMCFVGLQRCRPSPTKIIRVFEYFTWEKPMSIVVLPAAIAGHIGRGKGFCFKNSFRTDQRKHKAFTPANQLPKRS